MEKLDFPMKNLRVSGKGGVFAKKVRETGKGRETSFLRHAPAKLGS